MHRVEIHNLCKNYFKVSVDVKSILFEDVPIAKGAFATIFSTPDHRVYALCTSNTSLSLRDIQQIIKSMGFKSKGYYAPHGDKDYFRRLGREIFRNAYPARIKWTAEEESYYQTLAPYSPALIQLGGVSRQIRRYNEMSNTWQKIYEPARRIWRATA